LGWSVAGPLGTNPDNNVSSFFIRQEDEFLNEPVEKMFQMDFSESTYSPDLSMSLEDQKALTMMENSLKIVDGHCQLDLPFCTKPDSPNNRSLDERRLHLQKLRLKKDPDLHAKYEIGIDEYVDKGYPLRSTQANRAMLRPTREAYGIYPTIQFCILKSQRSQELCSTAPPSMTRSP
jgi:hypothetical protein